MSTVHNELRSVRGSNPADALSLLAVSRYRWSARLERLAAATTALQVRFGAQWRPLTANVRALCAVVAPGVSRSAPDPAAWVQSS